MLLDVVIHTISRFVGYNYPCEYEKAKKVTSRPEEGERIHDLPVHILPSLLLTFYIAYL